MLLGTGLPFARHCGSPGRSRASPAHNQPAAPSALREGTATVAPSGARQAITCQILQRRIGKRRSSRIYRCLTLGRMARSSPWRWLRPAHHTGRTGDWNKQPHLRLQIIASKYVQFRRCRRKCHCAGQRVADAQVARPKAIRRYTQYSSPPTQVVLDISASIMLRASTGSGGKTALRRAREYSCCGLPSTVLASPASITSPLCMMITRSEM